MKIKRVPTFGRQDRTKFERYVRASHGEPLIPVRFSDDDAVFGPSLRSIRTYMRNCFESRDPRGRPFRIYPGFVHKEELNAFAWRFEEVHVCGIYAGLAVALLEFSHFCFSRRELFKEIGSPARERSPSPMTGYAPGLWILRSDVLTDTANFQERVRWLTPVDPQRSAMAYYMCHLALRFVWLHELYHCLNGHVGFEISRHEPFCLDERPKANLGTAFGRQRRCLEFDADQSAFWTSCQIQLNGTDNIIGIGRLDRELRLKLLLFAIYGTLWILEETHRRGRLRRSPSHPSPYTRLHNVVRCLAADVAPASSDLAAIQQAALAECDVLGTILPRFFTGRRVLQDIEARRILQEISRYGRSLDTLRAGFIRFGYQ